MRHRSRESERQLHADQHAPEREGTAAAIPAETLAGIGIEELHVEVHTAILGAWIRINPSLPDAEMTVAQPLNDVRGRAGKDPCAIIDQDEVVARSVPLGEVARSIEAKYRACTCGRPINTF
jgi:hypothetical protein